MGRKRQSGAPEMVLKAPSPNEVEQSGGRVRRRGEEGVGSPGGRVAELPPSPPTILLHFTVH